MRPIAALLVTFAAAGTAGCGSESAVAGEPTLGEWRSEVCAVLLEHRESLDAPDAITDPEDDLLGAVRVSNEAMQDVVDEVTSLAPPAERRDDAERFVALLGEMADQLEELLPQMEARQEQIEEALEKGDFESLPPDDGLMGPADQAAADRHAAEAERLTKSLGLEECVDAAPG